MASTRLQVMLHVVLLPAIERVYPALTSQFVLLMLASSITSQISAEELTAIANRMQSDTFRSFEVYVVVAVFYLLLSSLYRLGFWVLGLPCSPSPQAGDAAVRPSSAPIISVYLLEAARWTLVLSLIAFVGGGVRGPRRWRCARVAHRACCAALASGYIQLVQGTPLLILLFLSYFGLSIMGYRLARWSPPASR